MSIDPQNQPQHDTVLDVTEEQIGRTYAQAFLGAVANDRSAVEELQAIIDEVLVPHPEFLEPLRSAFLSHEDRSAMIDRVFGGRVGPKVVDFLKVLSKHNRLGILKTVASQATKLFERTNGNVRVQICSAEPLDASLLAEIETTLRAKTGKEPVMRLSVDPELIAGMQVHIGDTVYDGSLKTSLERTKQSILNHTIEQIERNPDNFLSSS